MSCTCAAHVTQTSITCARLTPSPADLAVVCRTPPLTAVGTQCNFYTTDISKPKEACVTALVDSDRSGHDASAPHFVRGGRPAADPATAPAPDLHRSLAETDPQVHAAIADELRRQQTTLEMIASEDFAPIAVVQAQGAGGTNKYAEGSPGRRYYGGCEHVDVIEQLAIDRLKALFGAEYANVQPHSGAQANAAVMAALLQPGDTILGLDLAHGGHLTHGMKLNFSGRLYDIAP